MRPQDKTKKPTSTKETIVKPPPPPKNAVKNDVVLKTKGRVHDEETRGERGCGGIDRRFRILYT
ncbi:LysM peptidoglycan-binding domain-containing protein [Sesbania bispinosa]|nr:LysM peptidoglycan-binding domain-containing protein [Sesbania bispinosa]